MTTLRLYIAVISILKSRAKGIGIMEYTNLELLDKAKDEIEAKQKIISKLSDDILDKLRDYLSSLDTLEDKVNG